MLQSFLELPLEPHVKISCEDLSFIPAQAYCVLEYVPGGTLKNFLMKNRRKKLNFEIVIQLALDLSRGLSYLYSKKIVHRDVKTTAKVADFGVGRIEAQNPNEMTGGVGTTGYTAPENLRPEIPTCCPSSIARIMRKCWDEDPNKRPDMDEVVRLLEAIDVSKGGGMIPKDQANFWCFCPGGGL